MKNYCGSIMKAALALLLGLSLGITAVPVYAKGGSGGGGGGGGSTTPITFEVRVTGYVTAINYVNHTISIGASYYGSGNLKVDDKTSVSFNNVSCNFEALKLGDWVEARYDYVTKVATKLSATGIVSP